MKFSAIALAVGVALSAASLAQSASATTINQRRHDQQDRIAQGVRSGRLTPGETARLERQERGINREDRSMRAHDNGRLTAQDRRILNRRLNRESGRIYGDKHRG